MKQEIEELRESVRLEDQADLMAAACNFGEASYYMREANKIRASWFGHGLNPNDLRERTHAALRSQQKDPT